MCASLRADAGLHARYPSYHAARRRPGRSKRFYIGMLGFQVALELPNLRIFLAGGNAVGIRVPVRDTPAGDAKLQRLVLN